MSGKVTKLKGLRAEHSMTQGDVAGKLLMSKATYNRKENGLGTFTTLEVGALLELFQVRYEDLFPRTGGGKW